MDENKNIDTENIDELGLDKILVLVDDSISKKNFLTEKQQFDDISLLPYNNNEYNQEVSTENEGTNSIFQENDYINKENEVLLNRDEMMEEDLINNFIDDDEGLVDELDKPRITTIFDHPNTDSSFIVIVPLLEERGFEGIIDKVVCEIESFMKNRSLTFYVEPLKKLIRNLNLLTSEIKISINMKEDTDKLFNAVQELAQTLITNTGLDCSVKISQTFYTSIVFNPNDGLLPVETMRFGNILHPNRFICHRTHEASDFDKYRRLLNAFHGSDDLPNSIILDLEHDKGEFSLKFGANTYLKKDPYAEEEEANEVVINLFANYIAFRKFIFSIKNNPDGLLDVELYFVLKHPLQVRCWRYAKYKTAGERMSRINMLRVSTWNSDDDNNIPISEAFVVNVSLKRLKSSQLYGIVNRFLARSDCEAEYRTMSIINITTRDYVCDPVDDLKYQETIMELPFDIKYLISAVFMRGGFIKDDLLLDIKKRNEFIDTVLQYYSQDSILTIDSLERLVKQIDKQGISDTVINMLKYLHNEFEISGKQIIQIQEDQTRSGFVRLRKLVITPTRTLLMPPEYIMSNRVLRYFDKNGERTLRVVFRDEDGAKMRTTSTGDYLIKLTVGNCLAKGFTICKIQFSYLGSSNSQMRDNGCYFIENQNGLEVTHVRKTMGHFRREPIPKLMARIGQCFTQVHVCDKIEITNSMIGFIEDFEGGLLRNGKSYIFSDGCGLISSAMMERIAKDIGIFPIVPSCIQFRFQGMKGVLAISEKLNSLNKAFENSKGSVMTQTAFKKLAYLSQLHFLFRPSQEKFYAPWANKIEIVKHSAPTVVCLNRPVINILDQVSLKQNPTTNERIRERIHQLYDQNIFDATEPLIDEFHLRTKLNEFPKFLNFKSLRFDDGFTLTREPFFRQLLTASTIFTIKNIMKRMKIKIPFFLGRTMFGVVDETGILSPGQVFFQYTHNIDQYKDSNNDSFAKVHVGRVMVSKNPCTNGGDIRMFDAVDIKQLHHLRDVIVFPSCGPRPHPDEMAGSDLDGDEYSVIWDDRLFLDNNEKPFIFTNNIDRNLEDANIGNLDEEMRNFLVDHIRQDSIGLIANALLVNSDIYGIDSKVCQTIAQKHSIAVDFAKSGVYPPPLTTKGTKKNPPELPERFPDYMEKRRFQSYESPRLLGQLYRRLKKVDDILTISLTHTSKEEIEIDSEFVINGWEAYKEVALNRYRAYKAMCGNILESYSIEHEFQLFSSSFLNLKNRISDADNDDLSQYNTAHVIESRLKNVIADVRTTFFQQFEEGRLWLQCTEKKLPNENSEVFRIRQVLERDYIYPSEEMMKLASAYYMVSYTDNHENQFLSFPWTLRDILVAMKVKARSNPNCTITTRQPLAEELTTKIFTFSKKHAFFKEFQEGFGPYGRYCPMLKKYVKHYKGLDSLLFFVCNWASTNEQLSTFLNVEQICIIFTKFLTNTLIKMNCESVSPNYLPSYIEPNSPPEDLSKMRHSIGRKFLDFLRVISLQRFRDLKFLKLDQPNTGYDLTLVNKEWVYLHNHGMETYLKISLSKNFYHVLPFLSEYTNERPTQEVIADMEPFVVEASGQYSEEELKSMINSLRQVIGIKHLSLRNITRGSKGKTQRYMVSAVGTLKERNAVKYHLSGSKYRTVPFFNNHAAFTVNNYIDIELALFLAKEC
ncbi:RNA-dependent RNA polymerase, eukaryotic-type family-containing protein [Strongyloides ratti]|uniref:RNA-directed RNA polymerase n=1 Tax=Strongyloides ratti TaxID=34506 RepID=A0A090LFN1_STRRB|nr:RNA-dependent RNA polymerase, eukaryotic-type family-containing protein [Strongyloides ratti]CEF66953.1 RNA-dependent RNA polymerase, eukaryotic-type family-containing protein [Strongyloides ratti]